MNPFSREFGELGDPATHILSIGVELLALKDGIEDAEIGSGVGATATGPLPAHGVRAEVGVDEGIPIPLGASVPGLEEVLHEHGGGDHTHAVVLPACLPELTHPGVDDRVAGAADLPRTQVLLIRLPGEFLELLAQRTIRSLGEMVDEVLGEFAPADLRHDGDSEIATRIANYEMAYRLQSSAPDLMDLSSESKETLELYGCDPKVPSFARACLLARRMVERGVRFINIYNEGWDAHSDVAGNVRNNCAKTDKASAALVKDLKRRGLLDSTLVVWGGEFGRTPMVESSVSLGRSQGRDHHPQAFSMWMAGGGIKGGQTIGETDEMGFNIVKDEVRVPDLQATILHCLGIDHERLTFRNAGLDFRLTGVEPCHVVKQLLA